MLGLYYRVNLLVGNANDDACKLYISHTSELVGWSLGCHCKTVQFSLFHNIYWKNKALLKLWQITKNSIKFQKEFWILLILKGFVLWIFFIYIPFTNENMLHWMSADGIHISYLLTCLRRIWRMVFRLMRKTILCIWVGHRRWSRSRIV